MTSYPEITKVSDEIVKLCPSIIKIMLISFKTDNFNRIKSFKLALIVGDGIKSMPELECSLYMQIDSDIPFDLVFYNISEWNDFKDNEDTFAWKINNTGAVLYG